MSDNIASSVSVGAGAYESSDDRQRVVGIGLLVLILCQGLLWNWLPDWAGSRSALTLLFITILPTIHLSFQWWVRARAFTSPPLCRSVLSEECWEVVDFIGWGRCQQLVQSGWGKNFPFFTKRKEFSRRKLATFFLQFNLLLLF